MDNNLVKQFIEKGMLLSPDLNDFDNLNSNIIAKINELKEKPSIINKDIMNFILKSANKNIDINWNDFDKSRIDFEKGRGKQIYKTFLDIFDYNISNEKKMEIDEMVQNIKKPSDSDVLEESDTESGNVLILKSYKEDINKKREIQDFVKYYKNRYEKIKNILLERVNLQNTVSINKLSTYDKKELSLIGFVTNKIYTKNNHIILTLEDNTGVMNLLISQNKKELYDIGKDIVLDDMIGVSGSLSKDIFFVNELFTPDIPYEIKQKKSSDEVYAVFISDIHLGIKNFLEEEFSNFINWLSANHGNQEQRELSKKIKYLFIVGDVVDGVGVYPGQEEDLVIKDIYKQYETIHNYLSKLPKRIEIVMCPGNHDAVRIAEPQPCFNEKINKIFSDLPNVKLVTNPSLINIHSSKDFEGFNILMYHGFSFPYYAENVESVRTNGGMERSDLIMKFLLNRRHLSPTHGATQYIPDINEDPLVIDKIPDFFATGHIHKLSTTNYKGVVCLNCSCWISQTKDQEKRGIVPDPGKVVLVNLNTRGIKIMNFIKDEV